MENCAHTRRLTDYNLITPYIPTTLAETVPVEVCIRCGQLFVTPETAQYMASIKEKY